MSTVDFSQEARHQGCMHIALNAIGETSNTLFATIEELLQGMPPLQLSEPKGTVLFLRFLNGTELPCWAGSGARKWDQFSAHKSVLGLLCVAQCYDADELDNIRSGFKECIKSHKPGLCASKCIIYGSKKNLESYIDPKEDLILIDCAADSADVAAEDVQASVVEEIVSELSISIFTSLRSRIAFNQKLIDDPSRTDPLPHFQAPVETKEASEESDQRQFSRSHLLARLNKNLADLYLLTGQLQMAGKLYRYASEQLKSQKDWLWVGGAYEGLSITAMMTKECEQVLGQKAQGVETSSTNPLAARFRGKYANPKSSPRGAGGGGGMTSSGSVFSNPANRSTLTNDSRRNKGGDSNHSSGTRHGTLPRSGAKSPSPSDMDHLEEGQVGGSGLVISNKQDPLSNFLDEDEDEPDAVMEDMKKEEEEALSLLIDSRLLQKDFSVNKFHNALVCFRKAGKMGSISYMESLLKFSKYLVKQKHYVKAAENLQKMLTIHSLSELDQLSLYRTLASIYNSMGFHRKAAMFTLYAARCAINIVKPNQRQLIYDAHTLLINCLKGYKLSHDLESLPSIAASHIGWPDLQANVLKDYVFLSRQLGKDLLVIRHACFLLEVLHRHMMPFDLKEVTLILEDVVKQAHNQCEVTPNFAPSVAGKLVSPVPLTCFPSIRSFYPRPLIKIMAPHRKEGFKPNLPQTKDAKEEKAGTSPFIYTPFTPGKRKGAKREEVLWVEKDPAEIALNIANPLPFELRVENMALMMEGSKVEIYPSSLTLPSESEQSQFALVSIPHEPGQVIVQGYEATVFGVHYTCHVKIAGDPIIRVIPQLPLLKVRGYPCMAIPERTEDTGGASERKISKAGVEELSLLDGESCQFQFELESVNETDITSISLATKEYNKDYCSFTWDDGSLECLLPLHRRKPSSLIVSIKAHIPSCFRLISDFTADISNPALFSKVGKAQQGGSTQVPEISQPRDTPPSGTTPTHTATTSSSPNFKRVPRAALQSILLGHRRKASNEGLEKPEETNSSLMDSLNLDHPLLNSRTNSGTLPNMRASTSSNKQNSFVRSKKTGSSRSGYSKKLGVESGWDYEGVIIGLDKRASIRSDPGDRDQGKVMKAHVGSGSVHTSPTSSMMAIQSDTSYPINIPHSTNTSHSDLHSSPILKPGSEPITKTQSLIRNTSLQSKGGGSVRGGRPSINKGNISLPTGPLYKEVPTPPKKMKVTGDFLFKYSGGQSLAEGYYREAEANMSVVVQPCLLFEQLDISNSEKSQEVFQFSFLMVNASTYQLSVTCTVNQAGLASSSEVMKKVSESLDPNSSKKFTLLIQKFNLDSDLSNSSGTTTEIHLLKHYSKKLAEMLSFHWEVEGSDRSGLITLDMLHLPLASMAIMKPLPILFSVMMNQQSYSPLDTTHSKNLSVGSLVRAFIKLTNNSPSPMPPSFLILEPYTFSQELRMILKNLTGRMVHSGSLITNIPKLSPGASFEHEVCMTFLYKGNYLMDVKCVVPTQQDPSTPPAPSPSQPPPPDSSDKLTPKVDKSNVTRSPIKIAKRQVPPKLPFVPPDVSLSPSSPSPPPYVLQKSAKALARKFEIEFSDKKKDSPQISNGPQSSPSSPKGKQSDVGVSDSETPPPVPTSKRPPIVKSSSVELTKQTSFESRKNRTFSSYNGSITLTKPVPFSPLSTTSSKTPSTLSHALHTKVQSSVLLSSRSKYQSLSRDHRAQSSMRVVSGPNFSFHIN